MLWERKEDYVQHPRRQARSVRLGSGEEESRSFENKT